MNYAALVDGLIRFEALIPWMYRDTLGYCTVGIGNLLHDANEACALPFVVDGELAAPEQIRNAFHAVMAMDAGKLAEHYKLSPSVEITRDDAINLASTRLRNEMIPGIKRTFNRFDSYPTPAQAALVDMAWNLGVSGLAKFQALVAACELGHWRTAAAECHRSTTRPERNDWTRDQFLACAVPDVA